MHETKFQPWQQRVVEERKELDKKIAALDKYLGVEAVYKVSVNVFVDMRMQLDLMQRYSAILSKRIAEFEVTE